MDLKDFVKSKPMLRYLLECYKGLKNPELRMKITNIENSVNTLNIEHRGEKNIGIPVYDIKVGSPTIGFFALLRIVLDALAYANYYGLTPYIRYEKCVSYQENHEIDGASNSFEYYFRLKNKITEFENSALVIQCEQAHFVNAISLYGLKKVNDYLISDPYYDFYATIFNKYLEINPSVLSKMCDDIMHLNIKSKYIGVHYRGTDFKNNYGNHPVSIGVGDYICEVKKLIEQYDYPVFLATDDSDALKAFRDEFGDRVIYFDDVVRGNTNLSVICNESNRQNHHFLLGYEVLRDMYTLAGSDVFVSGLSQVSMFAEIYKRAEGNRFSKHVVISKGVNHNSKSHVTDINKYRSK